MHTSPLTPFVWIVLLGVGCGSQSQYDTDNVPYERETGIDYDFNEPATPSQGPDNPQVVPPPRAAPNPSPTPAHPPTPSSPELEPDEADLRAPDPDKAPGPPAGTVPPRPVTASAR